MPQVLLEAGSSDLRPIVQAAQVVLGKESFRAERLPSERTHELDYEPAAGAWVDFEDDLSSARASSLRFMVESGSLRWLLIYAPNFDSQGVPWWSLVVETRARDYAELFRSMREVPGLRYVIVSNEDTLDLHEAALDPETFPWDDDRLIRAALVAGGSWVDRHGPAVA